MEVSLEILVGNRIVRVIEAGSDMPKLELIQVNLFWGFPVFSTVN